jgi:hypothetical protein
MKSVVLVFQILLLTGCASATQALSNASDIAINIDEDAVQMNESHTKSINSVIALNILRARDRMPTGYTTLSGITNQPTRKFDLGTELSPIGLGNPVNPLGKSKVTASGTRGASAQYSVNPFAGGKGSQSLYTTSESDVFLKRYWDAGWPKDVLIALFVRKGKSGDKDCVLQGDAGIATHCGDLSKTFSEDGLADGEFEKSQDPLAGLELGNSTAFDCTSGTCTKRPPGRLKLEDCKKVNDTLTELLFSSGDQSLSTRIRAIEKAAGGKKLLIGLETVSLCPPGPPAELMLLRKVGGKYSVVLSKVELRSFDDMIYFLGETLRTGTGKSLKVKCGAKPVSLFVLKKKDEMNGAAHYGIELQYGGSRWRALPYPDGKTGDCDAGRTGTVLAILSQMFVLSQSKEFLEAPDILLAR